MYDEGVEETAATSATAAVADAATATTTAAAANAAASAAEHPTDMSNALPQDGGAGPRGPAAGRDRAGGRAKRATARPRPRSAMAYSEAETRMDMSAWFPENDAIELRAIAREEAQMMIRRAEEQAKEIQNRKDTSRHSSSHGVVQTPESVVAEPRARDQDEKKARMHVWESAMERVYPTDDGAPANRSSLCGQGRTAGRDLASEGDGGRGDGRRRVRDGYTGRPLSAKEREKEPPRNEDVGYMLDAAGEHHRVRTGDGTAPLVRRKAQTSGKSLPTALHRPSCLCAPFVGCGFRKAFCHWAGALLASLLVFTCPWNADSERQAEKLAACQRFKSSLLTVLAPLTLAVMRA